MNPMKNFVALILLIYPIIGHSQFFVGDSKEYVKSVFEKNDILFTEDILTDTTHRFSWLVENQFQMILVFNTKDVVIRQTLIPEKVNGVNEFVKWFNEDFVVVSDTEWKNYENGRIYKIKLKYILRKPYFSITLIP